MTEPDSFDQSQPGADGAHMSLRIGKAVAFDARITAAGLLAVSALVGSSLLGSAVIVLAARRHGRIPPPAPPERLRIRPPAAPAAADGGEKQK